MIRDMRLIKFVLKFTLGVVMVTLALAWMIFFGAFGVACVATVFFAPAGIASFGLATMPLFAALGWLGIRRPAQQVVIVNH